MVPSNRRPSLPSRAAVGIFLAVLAFSAGARDMHDPKLKSSSVLVVDKNDSTVLYSRNSDVAAPIASITKLMTALVVLDAKQPLDEPIRITDADRDLPKAALFPACRRHHIDPGRLDASGADVIREPRRACPGQQLSGRNAGDGACHERKGRRSSA